MTARAAWSTVVAIGTLTLLTARVLRWLSVALLLAQVALAGQVTVWLMDHTIERRALFWALLASIPLIPLATASLNAGMASENARSPSVSASWMRSASMLSRVAIAVGALLILIAAIDIANAIGALLMVAIGSPLGGYVGPGWQSQRVSDAALAWLRASYSGMAGVIALASGRGCLRVVRRRSAGRLENS